MSKKTMRYENVTIQADEKLAKELEASGYKEVKAKAATDKVATQPVPFTAKELEVMSKQAEIEQTKLAATTETAEKVEKLEEEKKEIRAEETAEAKKAAGKK